MPSGHITVSPYRISQHLQGCGVGSLCCEGIPCVPPAQPLDEPLKGDGQGQAEIFGVEEFCRRVAERTDARPRTTEWDAGAMLSTLADAVSGGELNQIISQLPSGYATLFGRADLAG
ncbi:DUF2267 domain-containing protein [Streptomyces sp. NPDC004059]